MFRYVCLNPIAQVGLDVLEEGYEKVEDLKGAQAALVRSASMHVRDRPPGRRCPRRRRCQ